MSDLAESNPQRAFPLSAIDKEELLKEIVAVIQGVPGMIASLGKGNSNALWTGLIIHEFRQLGHRWGCSVCPDHDDRSGEWLYDVSWYRNNEAEQLVEVPLVLESEWSHHWEGVRYDFEKLLQARAGFKVMILEEGNDCLEETWGKLVSSIRAFGAHGEDECYVLAGFHHQLLGFDVRIVRDPTNPSIERIPFKES